MGVRANMGTVFKTPIGGATLSTEVLHRRDLEFFPKFYRGTTAAYHAVSRSKYPLNPKGIGEAGLQRGERIVICLSTLRRINQTGGNTISICLRYCLSILLRINVN